MSLGNPPEVALWLRVPDDCRLRGDFEVGNNGKFDVHVALGGNGDDTNLLFERATLVRFVALAQRMLAIPDPHNWTITTRAVLESSPGYEIREVPTIAIA
jgi:hypothetical protein